VRRLAAVFSGVVGMVLSALIVASCDHSPNGEKHYSYFKEMLIDTVLVGGPVVSGDSILLVCHYPGGCNRLDSAGLTVTADTLRAFASFEFYYRGEPCAHGPGIDSVYLHLDAPPGGEYFVVYRNTDSGTTVIPITILPSYTKRGWRPASSSFFPLETGNRWVFAEMISGEEVRRDTITISESLNLEGRTYYHIHAPWQATGGSFWGRFDTAGNLLWRLSPEDSVRALFSFEAPQGGKWYIGPMDCIDSLRMLDRTPLFLRPPGDSIDAREFLGIPRCLDFNWSVSFARGIGPMRWMSIGIPPEWVWVLQQAEVADSCCREP